MGEMLYRAGDGWSDLTDTILDRVAAGERVLWMSFSGTTQLFSCGAGDLVRLRQGSRRSPLPGDGLPLIVEPPFFATACGCGDGSGYRSTRPLIVAAVTRNEDVAQIVQEGRNLGRRLVADGWDGMAVPPGHPRQPCRALYCRAFTLETLGDEGGGEPTFTQAAWYRGAPVLVPDWLPALPRQKAFAEVEVPGHLQWSHGRRHLDLAARADRIRMYELVLREGTPNDVRRYVDPNLLIDAFPELNLPVAVRAAWAPTVARWQRSLIGGEDE